mmetsp:Transcript_14552/g.16143  ORF Transcript_14552/g.16143 Transcript_14552/m.16143 type:complete len:270 (+) Transcript_14552:41-850(+)
MSLFTTALKYGAASLVLFACMLALYKIGQMQAADVSGSHDIKGKPVIRDTTKRGQPYGNKYGFDIRKIEHLSWSPRVSLYHDFISKEDREHIIAKGKSHLTESTVAGKDGMDVKSSHRSSTGAFLGFLDNDPVIQKVEARIATWTQLPAENGELLYLLRYQINQQYKAHHDYFADQVWIRGHGNRIATVLVYLGSPEEGGQTAFPRVGLEVEAKAGDAVLFWDYHPNVTPDPNSLHQGKPVLQGTKWCMTKWIRMRKFKNFNANDLFSR